MSNQENLPAPSQGRAPAAPVESSLARALPSGRTLVLRAAGASEEIEIRSASGELELAISLTEQGPVLTLRGARLEIDSTDTVAVRCKELDLQAAGGIRLQADGEIGIHGRSDIRVKSAGETFIDGEFVNLNCLDREGYHDHEEWLASQALGAADEEPGALPAAEGRTPEGRGEGDPPAG